jgi:hypothetical protein
MGNPALCRNCDRPKMAASKDTCLMNGNSSFPDQEEKAIYIRFELVKPTGPPAGFF